MADADPLTDEALAIRAQLLALLCRVGDAESRVWAAAALAAMVADVNRRFGGRHAVD